MRIWNTQVEKLCNQHLLGEHLETHMFRGAIMKGQNISGFIKKGLVIPKELKKRHSLLATEMKNRGMNHHSPFEDFPIPEALSGGEISVEENERELKKRCPECRSKWEKEEVKNDLE